MVKNFVEAERFESSWFYRLWVVLLALFFLPAHKCSSDGLFHRGRDAKIILHIGPHKTGSTHFQGQTLLMAKMLNAAGFCKYDTNNVKLEHDLSVAIQKNSHHDLDSFYRHCLDSGKRVIISSESFSSLNRESQFTALKRFIGNNSVHIVAVYREPLTRFQSIHSEIYKQATEVVRSFHSFVKEYTAVEDAFFYSFMDKYVQYFGRQNITVLDYYGMEAIGRDVTRVVLCDVADVLCAEPYPSASRFSNEREDMLPYELFEMVISFVTEFGCKMAPEIRGPPQLRIIRGYAEAAKHLPTHEVPYSVLSLLASVADAQVREKYEDIMLYSNRTATAEALARAKVTEINKSAFFANRTWTGWLHAEAQRLVREKVFVDCFVPLITDA